MGDFFIFTPYGNFQPPRDIHIPLGGIQLSRLVWPQSSGKIIQGNIASFWGSETCKNNRFSNIPFAKVQSVKNAVFEKKSILPWIFMPESRICLVRKLQTWFVFFSENLVFWRKQENLLVANCKGNMFLIFDGKCGFAPENQHKVLYFASFAPFWPDPLRKTVELESNLNLTFSKFHNVLSISPSQNKNYLEAFMWNSVAFRSILHGCVEFK